MKGFCSGDFSLKFYPFDIDKTCSAFHLCEKACIKLAKFEVSYWHGNFISSRIVWGELHVLDLEVVLFMGVFISHYILQFLCL